MTDVLVTGAAGRMGSLSARTIAAQDDLRLVAARRPAAAGDDAGRDVPLFTSVEAALALTAPDGRARVQRPRRRCPATSAPLLKAGVRHVVGATGLRRPRSASSASSPSGGRRLLVVPNFALGAVLLMDFAAEAAAVMRAAEIMELHETDKLDAPSGTALRTAQLMAGARRDAGQAAAGARPPKRGLPARGHVEDGRAPSTACACPGLVAHQEVVFGGDGRDS